MTENFQLTEQDIEDLQKLSDESRDNGEATPAASFTLLRVWQEILSNIDKAREERVTPEVATKILRAWPFLKIQEVARYQELYFDYLDEMRQVVDIEIELEPAALKNVENDAEDNKSHYLNLLLQWQLAVQQWSADWEVASEDAHIRVAALAEAQNFVLGPQGLVAHLDQINFDFTDEESAELIAILEDAKAGR